MVALLASRVPDVKLHAQWPHIYRLRQEGRCKARSFYNLFLLCVVVFIKEAQNQKSTTGHGMKKNIYTHTAVSAELKNKYKKKDKESGEKLQFIQENFLLIFCKWPHFIFCVRKATVR